MRSSGARAVASLHSCASSSVLSDSYISPPATT